MDMFGGLTKTSSRIALAAAFGLMLGGFAFKATPAKAADLGGDCCADLEERVAELEATTVRKGNKKVSVTLSGWVVKTMNWWDDGHTDSFAVGDKDYDLASRFAITGSATIAPGWSAGFNLTVVAPGNTFGILSNQLDEFNGVNSIAYGNTAMGINTLYSYIYIKSDKWGTLNWGTLSPASDNPAVLADISGTVIESNFVGFEGPGFLIRSGGSGYGGLIWHDFWMCNSGNAPGADCFGLAQPAVRYDSPTWGGFRFETSYGTYSTIQEILDQVLCDYPYDSCMGKYGDPNKSDGYAFPATKDSHFWDIALFYTADWNSIKISFAYAFTWIESNWLNGGEENIHQVGGTIMHKPSGLGIYATGNWDLVGNNNSGYCGALNGIGAHEECWGSIMQYPGAAYNQLPDNSMFGVKPFWRTNWSSLGATIIYGEYAEYYDYYARANLIEGLATGGASPLGCTLVNHYCYVTSSTLRRPGAGIVQEIDSAAMHVWFRWQGQSLDAKARDEVNDVNFKFKADDFNLFQVGGVMFF
jgi:Gram-negative porin